MPAWASNVRWTSICTHLKNEINIIQLTESSKYLLFKNLKFKVKHESKSTFRWFVKKFEVQFDHAFQKQFVSCVIFFALKRQRKKNEGIYNKKNSNFVDWFNRNLTWELWLEKKNLLENSDYYIFFGKNLKKSKKN